MISATETQFVRDDAGRRVTVLIGIERYRQLLEAMEEIEAIRAYDDAKSSGDERVELGEAVRRIAGGAIKR